MERIITYLKMDATSSTGNASLNRVRPVDTVFSLDDSPVSWGGTVLSLDPKGFDGTFHPVSEQAVD
jgi:hypothetical protein